MNTEGSSGLQGSDLWCRVTSAGWYELPQQALLCCTALRMYKHTYMRTVRAHLNISCDRKRFNPALIDPPPYTERAPFSPHVIPWVHTDPVWYTTFYTPSYHLYSMATKGHTYRIVIMSSEDIQNEVSVVRKNFSDDRRMGVKMSGTDLWNQAHSVSRLVSEWVR